MDISTVIGWKHNHQEGMRCKDINGVMTIIEFPGGIPSKAKQKTWTDEYEAWVAAGGKTDAELDEKVDFANVDPFLKAYVLAVNDGSFVPGSNYTGAQIKTIIKAKM